MTEDKTHIAAVFAHHIAEGTATPEMELQLLEFLTARATPPPADGPPIPVPTLAQLKTLAGVREKSEFFAMLPDGGILADNNGVGGEATLILADGSTVEVMWLTDTEVYDVFAEAAG